MAEREGYCEALLADVRRLREQVASLAAVQSRCLEMAVSLNRCRVMVGALGKGSRLPIESLELDTADGVLKVLGEAVCSICVRSDPWGVGPRHRLSEEKPWAHQPKDLGLLARAVLVVDRAGRVAYREIVPEVTAHPNYDRALAALRAAI